MNKWDIRFLRLAREVSRWSKDPSTKVGAVITKGNRVLSLGYNGFSRTDPDKPHNYHIREEKLARVIHAEMNAVLEARESLDRATLYTWPLGCCERCAAHMLHVGIRRFVHPPVAQELKERWRGSLDRAQGFYADAGAEEVILGVDLDLDEVTLGLREDEVLF
jgi:dCMP deaminase